MKDFPRSSPPTGTVSVVLGYSKDLDSDERVNYLT